MNRNVTFVIAGTLFVLSPLQAFALSPEVCRVRADLVASAAVERDKGVDKKVILHDASKKLGPSFAKSFEPYVDAVYARPGYSPAVLRKVVYDTCLAE